MSSIDRDERVPFRTLKTPTTGIDELDVLGAEFQGLAGRYREAATTLTTADNDLRIATDTDREALAVAIRAGSPDPGSPAVDAHQTRMAALTRTRDALGTAAAAAADEYLVLLRRHRGDLDQIAAAKRDTAAAAMRVALDQLEAAWHTLGEAQAFAGWVDRGDALGAYKPRPMPYVAANGETVVPTQLLGHLRELVSNIAAVDEPVFVD